MEGQEKFNRLKACLVREGITQVEIARELGISSVTVHQVLRSQCESARVKGLIIEKLGWNPWEENGGNDRAY